MPSSCERRPDSSGERTEAARNFHMLSSRQEALLAALPEIIMEVDRNKVYVWANQRGMGFSAMT